MPGLGNLIIDKRSGARSTWSASSPAGLQHCAPGHDPRHMFGLRPLPGYSDYTTPIRGLYQCGSSCWPGGTVTGVPGHNASRKILGDLERRRGPRRLRAAS